MALIDLVMGDVAEFLNYVNEVSALRPIFVIQHNLRIYQKQT
jgi:hypothetical protein